ncbi:hypothetical protein BDP55DRAFT_637428 [Colletotrichum godetiae]|uniref:Uncharacterized protein n=1 Tax=Colletotrichum godetiae TaxID=1209918 RepID=A0AAJ0ERV8_9PEZI|nr:uncharacterized protein BDP55DRAFT_637428 [Colletotrichum godetiae]KAK1658924.1 hypothetical protein BDP55DRAFT_637428 [Colletotrichum godetiae]
MSLYFCLRSWRVLSSPVCLGCLILDDIPYCLLRLFGEVIFAHQSIWLVSASASKNQCPVRKRQAQADVRFEKVRVPSAMQTGSGKTTRRATNNARIQAFVTIPQTRKLKIKFVSLR